MRTFLFALTLSLFSAAAAAEAISYAIYSLPLFGGEPKLVAEGQRIYSQRDVEVTKGPAANVVNWQKTLSISIVEHPLNLLVTRPAAHSQRMFASEALTRMPSSERVSAEAGDDGLTIRGLTELDLELAVWELKKQFADLETGKPTVRYMDGPSSLLEPYYVAAIDTSEEAFFHVIADLPIRRGLVTSVLAGPIGKRLRVEIPVSECFGYYTVLRALTRKRGEVTFEFLGYRPVGSFGGETDASTI